MKIIDTLVSASVKMDLDRDGRLSTADVLTAAAGPLDRARTALVAMDRNRDGALTTNDLFTREG